MVNVFKKFQKQEKFLFTSFKSLLFETLKNFNVQKLLNVRKIQPPAKVNKLETSFKLLIKKRKRKIISFKNSRINETCTVDVCQCKFRNG